MKKHLIKITGMMLVIALVFTFAGCGKEGVTNESVARNEKGFPESIDIWGYAPDGFAVKTETGDPNGLLSWKLMEKHTGTHINWSGDVWSQEKFNIMIASGNLPDFIVYHNLADSAKSFADDGVIVPLRDKIKNNMPNLNAFLEEQPETLKEFLYDDGEIYYLPIMRYNPNGVNKLIFFGPIIRQDWLDKLNLPVPTTTDELYETLKAFKAMDSSIYPMVSFGNFMQLMAGPFGTTNDLYVDNGQIKYGIMEDRFEEFLKYMKKLYDEELLDPNFLIDDRSKVDAKIIGNKAGFANHYQPTRFQDSMDDGERRIAGIPYLTGPYGDRKYFHAGQNSSTTAPYLALTTACEDPEGALKWLDELFSETGRNFMNFGKEGETYEWVDGYPTFTDMIMNSPDGTSPYDMVGKYIANNETTFPNINDIRLYDQTNVSWGREAREVWGESADFSGILPTGVFFTDEEEKVNTQIMAQITPYAEEYMNSVIVGNDTLENLPAVRAKIKQLGIDTVIQNYQNAYERYLKK